MESSKKDIPDSSLKRRRSIQVFARHKTLQMFAIDARYFTGILLEVIF